MSPAGGDAPRGQLTGGQSQLREFSAPKWEAGGTPSPQSQQVGCGGQQFWAPHWCPCHSLAPAQPALLAPLSPLCSDTCCPSLRLSIPSPGAQCLSWKMGKLLNLESDTPRTRLQLLLGGARTLDTHTHPRAVAGAPEGRHWGEPSTTLLIPGPLPPGSQWGLSYLLF